MNSKTFKPMMLALAGAVALAGAGSAHAAEQYALYKGETTLTSAVGTVNCWLTVAGTIDDVTGQVRIKGAGSVSGDVTCRNIFLGNFPWEGNVTGLPTGPGNITLDTSVANPAAPSVLAFSGGVGQPLCGGPVDFISYTTTSGTPQLPDDIDINPSAIPNNFGGSCTITGTLTRRLP
ncbi:hypothetical protein [Alloalcanivorax xenomutans]|uniref:hypothetical protein n=1 Tax=Alloalcanivorax xenomutans TaxID=1094342 RepID=UPI002931ECCC|nr:hypothetical protein [Alloalcanivorax xenomutans]WOA29742.1 hypothetical protein RVY87_12715 [Alloalcanivorax xenomutans]